MPRRLRVLVVPSWYPHAGRPTHGIFVQQQAQALATVCDVAVIHTPLDASAKRCTVAHEGDLTVVRVPPAEHSDIGTVARRARHALALASGYRRACLAALRALEGSWGRPDVIHAHASIPASLGARIMSRHLGVPYIITEHQAEFLPESPGLRSSSGRMLPRMIRGAMREARAVIAVSRHLADALVNGGYRADPIVIPNLVPSMKLPAQPVVVPEDGVARIVHVSLLNAYEKNIPMLLDALKSADERSIPYLMDFVGDGPDRVALESRAAELGLLDRRVRFLGTKSAGEVRELFDAANFSIVSSRYETFSMAAAESLAAGRPVISTKCGGPEDFVDESVGLLVDNDDADAMANAVEWMCGHFMRFEPHLLHEHAEKKFATELVVGRLVDLYRQVIDSGASEVTSGGH